MGASSFSWWGLAQCAFTEGVPALRVPLLDRIRAVPWTRRRKDWAIALALAVAIAAGWMHVGGFFGEQRFSDPISYRGDAYFSAAVVAAARRGDWFPFSSKLLPSLGAPFVANWNDYPGTDDVVFWLVGLLARLTDTIVAINLGYMLACITAGLSMFFVARRYGFRREGAVLSGFLFGLAHYIFVRTVHHYSLTFIAVVPWNILVMSYLASRRGLPFKSARFRIAAIVTVLTGWSFVYYIFFAAQLYVLGALAGLMRNGKKLKWKPIAALAAIFAAAVLSVSLDTIVYTSQHGPNAAVIARAPTDVEFYALKPVDLFVASHMHRFAFMREAWRRSRAEALINGESPGPYLGWVGGAFLLSLALTAMSSIARRARPTLVVAFAGTAAWFIIGHSVGGLNSMMGLLQIVLFRSVNRASVVVLALAMLFGAWAVPRVLRRLPALARWPLVLTVGVLGFLEQFGGVNPMETVANNRAQANNDRHLAAAMEAALPKGSMVFQLPAMHFPEVGPTHAVDGYELFRPYFFADTLRFSHGDMKGRPNADWKFRIAALPGEQMVAELKSSGFSSILLNRKGFPDGGAGLYNQLLAAGCRVVAISELKDNVAFALP